MKKLYWINLLCFLVVIGCQNKKEKPLQEEVAVSDTIIQEIKLPELEGGDVFLKNKDPFGEILELKGKQILTDTFLFKPKESKMLLVNGYLILSNLPSSTEANHFHFFQYPEMKYLYSSGAHGNGADEFVYPFLVPTQDKTLSCYILEGTREKMYAMDKDGNITLQPFAFSSSMTGRWSHKLDMVNLGPDDFIYADNSKTGKSIFRTHKQNDSIITTELFSLQLNLKRKSPFTYIGDFGVNEKKNRMVYAYKYFKILKFMDMEANTVRTLNFEQGDFNDGSLMMMDGLDQNVTHYWGMCAQDDYVYCLYSGRTPIEVGREGGKGILYIYVEQFDWNGNPVRKYKLDHWGYFTVDEKGKRLILVSTWDDDPFFVYQLSD